MAHGQTEVGRGADTGDGECLEGGRWCSYGQWLLSSGIGVVTPSFAQDMGTLEASHGHGICRFSAPQ